MIVGVVSGFLIKSNRGDLLNVNKKPSELLARGMVRQLRRKNLKQGCDVSVMVARGPFPTSNFIKTDLASYLN